VVSFDLGGMGGDIEAEGRDFIPTNDVRIELLIKTEQMLPE
jgi:hypothetical protein